MHWQVNEAAQEQKVSLNSVLDLCSKLFIDLTFFSPPFSEMQKSSYTEDLHFL